MLKAACINPCEYKSKSIACMYPLLKLFKKKNLYIHYISTTHVSNSCCTLLRNNIYSWHIFFPGHGQTKHMVETIPLVANMVTTTEKEVHSLIYCIFS